MQSQGDVKRLAGKVGNSVATLLHIHLGACVVRTKNYQSTVRFDRVIENGAFLLTCVNCELCSNYYYYGSV